MEGSLRSDGIFITATYLEHFGVKGMRWGVRKKEDPAVSKIKTQAKQDMLRAKYKNRVANYEHRQSMKRSRSKAANEALIKKTESARFAKGRRGSDEYKNRAGVGVKNRKGTRGMSNEELRSAIERMRLEKEYQSVLPKSRQQRLGEYIFGAVAAGTRNAIQNQAQNYASKAIQSVMDRGIEEIMNRASGAGKSSKSVPTSSILDSIKSGKSGIEPLRTKLSDIRSSDVGRISELAGRKAAVLAKRGAAATKKGAQDLHTSVSPGGNLHTKARVARWRARMAKANFETHSLPKIKAGAHQVSDAAKGTAKGTMAVARTTGKVTKATAVGGYRAASATKSAVDRLRGKPKASSSPIDQAFTKLDKLAGRRFAPQSIKDAAAQKEVIKQRAIQAATQSMMADVRELKKRRKAGEDQTLFPRTKADMGMMDSIVSELLDDKISGTGGKRKAVKTIARGLLRRK